MEFVEETRGVYGFLRPLQCVGCLVAFLIAWDQFKVFNPLEHLNCSLKHKAVLRRFYAKDWIERCFSCLSWSLGKHQLLLRVLIIYKSFINKFVGKNISELRTNSGLALGKAGKHDCD